MIWSLRRLRPDFKTIADFRRDNREAFRQVSREFVRLCRELDLYGRELVAVDGTRIKAGGRVAPHVPKPVNRSPMKKRGLFTKSRFLYDGRDGQLRLPRRSSAATDIFPPTCRRDPDSTRQPCH